MNALESLLGGRARDGALLITTLDIAAQIKHELVPSGVVWQGRRADVNTVDIELRTAGLIHFDDSGSILTQNGKKLAAAVESETRRVVFERLIEWAEVQLKALIGDGVGGLVTPMQGEFWFSGGMEPRGSAEQKWALTRGLVLLCSCDDADKSHESFSNYLMNARWWNAVGPVVATSICRLVALSLADSRDAHQAAVLGRAGNPGPDGALMLYRATELDVIVEFPERGAEYIRDLLRDLYDTYRAYSPAKKSRKTSGKPMDPWVVGLLIWSGSLSAKPLEEIDSDVAVALERYGMVDWLGKRLDLQRLNEWVREPRPPLSDEDRFALCSTNLSMSELCASIVRYDYVERLRSWLKVADSPQAVVWLKSTMALAKKQPLGPAFSSLIHGPLPPREPSSEVPAFSFSLMPLYLEDNAECLRLAAALFPDFDPAADYRLHWAAEQGKLNVVKLILREGLADVESKDDLGETVLQVGAQHGKANLVKWLVEEGMSDVNAQTSLGMTSLMLSANRGDLDTVQHLVAGGADVDLTDFRGMSALDYARREERGQVVAFLETQ